MLFYLADFRGHGRIVSYNLEMLTKRLLNLITRNHGSARHPRNRALVGHRVCDGWKSTVARV